MSKYNYPQTSCGCYKCTQNTYQDPQGGIPTNMSIRDCKVNDPYFDCYNTRQFSNTSIQPNPRSGLTAINPQVFRDKYAKDFFPANCNVDKSCPELQWYSPDPRLVSIPHLGQRQTLSNPPLDSSVCLDQVAVSEELNGYGQKYASYSDINAGQILYYTDHSREDPFFEPLFTNSAKVTGHLYKDPMGALKPRGDREPMVQGTLGQKRDKYPGCLSWMQDSTAHREDIMSKQMNVANQSRWEPRWANN